jgi:tripartite-type tricarboxylate transporter receptor subunit TctC
LRDFSYITGLSEFTFGVVVKSTSPWHTIEDLIAAGKKEPEKYNCGTSGIGGTGHLPITEIEQASGARFTHVPYKGGAEFMPALLGEHIHFVPDGAQWAPFVESGHVRLLAMATPVRFPKYPDKPTLVERGIHAIAVSPYGLVGPRTLPQAAIQTLHEVFREAMNDPAHQPLLDRYIQIPWRRDPAGYRAFAEKCYEDVKPLLVKSGLAKA